MLNLKRRDFVSLLAGAAISGPLTALAQTSPKTFHLGTLTPALPMDEKTPLGIVYETDAKIEPAVKVIGVFPDNTHDPITYPVALTANAKSDAVQYLSFLRSRTAKSIFEKYGFNFLVRPTS